MDLRLFAPATVRNRAPILEILREALPPTGRVLEVAAGTGEHACFFAAQLPQLEWVPTDPEPSAVQSIEAWIRHTGVTNVTPPQALDVHTLAWPKADAVVCINMLHIAPWSATGALMTGAGRVLPHGGVLFVYGPFLRSDRATAQSNMEFDASLRQRDPAWGLRTLEQVQALAAEYGLALYRAVEMPANNLSLIFKRERLLG